MAKEQKRLGRGLSSLISPEFTKPREQAAPGELRDDVKAYPHHAVVPIHAVKRNPFQPRQTFPEKGMADLVQSIKQTGLLQPLVVRPAADGFQLIAGERRLRAAIQAGLNDVPVVVHDASDEQVLEIALVENIHREDLNAIERANAYRKYADQFKLPTEQIARRVGEDRSTVANYLRLLELNDDIKRLVADGSLSMGHARCLLGITNERERWELAAAVVEHDLSVRALEDIIRRRKRRQADEAASAQAKPEPRPLVRAIQEELTGTLGMRVTIRERRKPNTGQIVIHYNSLDDFNRVTESLGLKPH
jgi:ParB family chromosome partitioning protein